MLHCYNWCSSIAKTSVSKHLHCYTRASGSPRCRAGTSPHAPCSLSTSPDASERWSQFPIRFETDQIVLARLESAEALHWGRGNDGLRLCSEHGGAGYSWQSWTPRPRYGSGFLTDPGHLVQKLEAAKIRVTYSEQLAAKLAVDGGDPDWPEASG